MTKSSFVPAIALASALTTAPIVAQAQGLELGYTRWWHSGTHSALYSGSFNWRLAGPIGARAGGFHRDDSRTAFDRTQTGGEFALVVGHRNGLYGIAGVGLGVLHADGNLDGAWSAGLGYGVTFFSLLRLSLEGRYLVEDRQVRGFWQVLPEDRRGVTLTAGLTLFAGSRRARGAAVPRPAREPIRVPDSERVRAAASEGGLSDESAVVATRVVETALSVMGTPYRWGGTNENGFDCSGLIQFAYGEHGVLLPRVSRDQARIGVRVEPDLSQLLPGDILGFSESGSGVTHVGLYVGDGAFIHSSSSGVRTSSLNGTDPDARWWRARWVSARRVLT